MTVLESAGCLSSTWHSVGIQFTSQAAHCHLLRAALSRLGSLRGGLKQQHPTKICQDLLSGSVPRSAPLVTQMTRSLTVLDKQRTIYSEQGDLGRRRKKCVSNELTNLLSFLGNIPSPSKNSLQVFGRPESSEKLKSEYSSDYVKSITQLFHYS